MLRLQAQLQLPSSLLHCRQRHHKSIFSKLLSHKCRSLKLIHRLTLNKTQLSIFQSRRPLCSFIPNQREGITSFFTVLFRTLDFTFTFMFYIFLICVWFHIKVHSYYFTCTSLHFTLSLPILLSLSQKQTTLKKGRDIIPDIFNKVLNRAFWRQNYIHF